MENRNWKRFGKKVVYWMLSPGVERVLKNELGKARRKISTPPEMVSKFAENIKFHNIHKGQRCFILGSGPSINKQNLKPLKNEICFAMSMFYLHKDVREINPLYHVDPPHHKPFGFDVLQKYFDGFTRVYSDKITYLFGYRPYQYSVPNFLARNPQYNLKNIHYLNYCQSDSLNELNYKNPAIWDICKPLFAARTALYSAIQVAVYMGFKHIYLLGCDHDYLQMNAKGSSTHFYPDEEGVDDSAFWLSTEAFLLSYHIRWKQYRFMREYLEPQDCYIYNATEGGLLDVFPRVTLSEALADKHK